MGILEDVLSALERIPLWKRVSKLPGEYEALEMRVKALENRLSGPKGLECPKCGEAKLMLQSSMSHPTFGFAGTKLDTYKCSSCGFDETRNRKASS
jgi:predicted RNA-binding Zn-ribbon protein involved in translation (DUF1610 family)